MAPADAPDARAESSRVCFLAIDVPTAIGHTIAGWVGPLLDPPTRPVEPDRLHVTLVYYGRVATDALDALVSEIERGGRSGPLTLEPDGPGAFGRGRVLWVGVEGDVARLATLRRELFAATARFGAASAGSVDGPEAEYVPHITVARVRGRSRSPRRFLEARPEWDASQHFAADRLTLFESARGRYRVLAEFPLQEGPLQEEGENPVEVES